MHALDALRELISLPDLADRKRAFYDWTDKWVEQVGSAATVTSELALAAKDEVGEMVKAQQARTLSFALLTRDGIMDRFGGPDFAHDASTFYALVTVLRFEPRPDPTAPQAGSTPALSQSGELAERSQADAATS